MEVYMKDQFYVYGIKNGNLYSYHHINFIETK